MKKRTILVAPVSHVLTNLQGDLSVSCWAFCCCVTYHPKKVAWPRADRTGSIKIKIVAIQTASEHLKRILRSLALKWSSHSGSFFLRAAADALVKYGLSTVSSPLSGASLPSELGFDMASRVRDAPGKERAGGCGGAGASTW